MRQRFSGHPQMIERTHMRYPTPAIEQAISRPTQRSIEQDPVPQEHIDGSASSFAAAHPRQQAGVRGGQGDCSAICPAGFGAADALEIYCDRIALRLH